jgi:opacity protein-like surface antigen
MKATKLIGPVVVGLATAATTVNAATDWSGAYVGASVGYQGGDVISAVNSDDTSVSDENLSFGGQIGFMQDFGSTVAGVEVGITKLNTEFDDDHEHNMDSMTNVRLKLGREVGESGLVYGMAGVAVVRGDTQSSDDDELSSYSNVMPSLGLGYEQKIDTNVSVFVQGEYMFGDVDTHSSSYGQPSEPDVIKDQYNISIGLNVRF